MARDFRVETTFLKRAVLGNGSVVVAGAVVGGRFVTNGMIVGNPEKAVRTMGVKRILKKKVCLIAQFPPPIHGLSKAVDTLYRSQLREEFLFEKVNLTDNRRFLSNLLKILRSNADLFYLTVSQTRGGNLRDLAILKLLEFQRRKVIIHLHGGYYRDLVENVLPRWQRKANCETIGRLAGAIVLSDSLRRHFEGMLPDERIFVVPNCVDDEILLSQQEFNEKLEALEHKDIFHILYLSNFIHAKGYAEVLRLALLEKGRVQNGESVRFHFDFAGQFFEEKEKKYFKSYIEENQLQSFVTYHGIVRGKEKKELFRQCDIFVLLTHYSKEGQPISILEAMGNGLTVVTTDFAGIPDVVANGENGFVLKREQDLSAVWEYLLGLDGRKISQIAGNNRAKCLTTYSQANYIACIRKVFDRA